MIADNLKSVTQRIARCCDRSGRPEKAVRLVCVTKEAGIEDIQAAILAGAADIGENRVQDAAAKHKVIGDKAVWHLIGHLQTNKVKDAVRIFSLIHSVDSLRLAEAIDKEAARSGKIQDILLQVNTSGELSKFGVKPEDAEGLLNSCAALRNISVKGLMTIAPEACDPETVRPYFKALSSLGGRLKAGPELSMGMTNDFEIAIEEGSTIVRVGRAIFK